MCKQLRFVTQIKWVYFVVHLIWPWIHTLQENSLVLKYLIEIWLKLHMIS